MASSYTCTLFILNFILLSLSTISSLEDDFVETLVATRTEKTSHLHFYFQDRPGGRNPTAVQIIAGKGLGFGATYMIDDALTRSADRGSEIIGRAQGMYSVATQNDLGLLMVVNFCFTQGKYNGSSLSMLGRNHVMDNVREMPIVGGSGLFRFARGYALAHTVWFDAKTGDATVQYNVSVNHF
ncbi:dirigent protein 22-like [Salvia hispanica]|uniref:dirigent protein 22-like n=1 Tax=Salvia hispanica TaxID=49212 RepID=UPI0020091B2D|nr:dirigent protein 22-like [Salvia hispanica]